MALDKESLGRIKSSVEYTEEQRRGNGMGAAAIGGRAQPIVFLGKPTSSILPATTGTVTPQTWGAGLDSADVTYPSGAEVQVANKSTATLATDTWYIFLWVAGAYVPIFTPYCPEGA